LRLTDPVCIKGFKLPNRLVASPVASATASVEGGPTEATFRRVEAILSSRAGLVVMEHHAVHPWGRVRRSQMMLHSDQMVPLHRPLAEMIWEAGSVPLVQLNHGGSAIAEADLMDLPDFRCVAPSAVPHPAKDGRVVPREMTPEEISELPSLFAAAFERGHQAGYCGVQVHACHGYLLGQFLSPITNRRTDRYGGDLRNRARVLLEVVEALAERAGDSILAVRLGVADFFPGDDPRGLTPEESCWVARELAALGVDLIGVSGNLCGPDAPQGFDPYSKLIMEAVGDRCLVECTGMVRSAERAQAMLSSRVCHLVGVARPLLSDPSYLAGWVVGS